MPLIGFGQITTTKVLEKKEEISIEPYDSLQNFLGKDLHRYIGQDFYLKGKAESLREYGYDGFLIDYKYKGYNREKNTYKCCDSYSSKYNELEGKYFNVINVHKHPRAKENDDLYGNTFYLELKEKESGDKVYFEYKADFEFSFPFIVVGFYEKLKEIAIGEKFILGGFEKRYKDTPDIKTGKSISHETGTVWECFDLTIEEKYYSLTLLLKDNLGQTLPVRYQGLIGEKKYYDSFTVEEADMYVQKFGKTNWIMILEGKINIGFSEEMVLLSWGKPKKINYSSSGDQWVYEEQYLYFENGKLKSYN